MNKIPARESRRADDRKGLMVAEHFFRVMVGILLRPIDFFFLFKPEPTLSSGLMNLIGEIEPQSLVSRSECRNNPEGNEVSVIQGALQSFDELCFQWPYS